MLTWVIAASLLVGAPALKEARKPAKAPAGDWTVEYLEYDAGGDIRKSYGGDTVPVRITAAGIAWLPRLDPQPAAFFAAGAGRAEVDINPGAGKDLRKGIWRLDDDILFLCTAAPGAARPTRFRPAAGSGQTLWVLKRVPKD